MISKRLHPASFSNVNTQLAQYTKLNLTNIIDNGDFSDGTNGWSALYGFSTLSSADNVLVVHGTGTANTVQAVSVALLRSAANKYYVKSKVRATNSVCTELSIGFYTGQGFVTQNSPVENTWYTLSGVRSGYDNVPMMFLHAYADAATANGKVMEVQYALVIDLTTTFGSGNEPTAEEMDNWMANFPNYWFDGTTQLDITQIWKGLLKEIHDIKTAYIAAHGGSL